MPRTVTSKIKELLQARDRKILSGTQYVQGLLDEVKKQILAELAATPVDSYSAYHMRLSLASVERYLSAFESAANRELSGGISDSFNMGGDLLPAVMQASGESGVYLGMSHLSVNTVETLQEFTFSRITNLSRELFTRIKGELTLGILGQKTPQQVAGEIAGTLTGPSIFKTVAERAEVITGLEMGRAFSVASQMSMDNASKELPDLQRMWLHAGHPRMPRQVHLLMHGQVRAIDAPFYQTPEGAKVHFPRDPQAPVKEVIRCGCDHVPFRSAWGSAKSFAASWDQSQYRANYKKAA